MTEENPANPATAHAPPEEGSPPRKGLSRKLILLLLALTCCCGSPILWIAVEAHRGNQIARLHDSLKPGMSVAEVLGRIDEVRLSSLGLGVSWVFADPEGTAEKGCRPITPHGSLAWGHNTGSPWGRRETPSLEEVARRFSSCDSIRLRAVANFSHFEFVVTLKDGRVSAISSIGGHLE
jgi:hypothetical protein